MMSSDMRSVPDLKRWEYSAHNYEKKERGQKRSDRSNSV